MMSCGRSSMPSGIVSRPEIVRDLGNVVHAAAEEGHFASVFGGEIQDLLQPVNGRAEAGDNQRGARRG